MTFGEKLKKVRKAKKLTQTQLAKSIGINFNTISNYEKGKTYPQNRQMYSDIAKVLGVDENYLKSENEEFILKEADKYGYTGKLEAQEYIQNTKLLFSREDLSEEEIDNIMQKVTYLYWDKKNTFKKAGVV